MTESPNETPRRLLDVAEELFAKHGVDQTSLREVTSRAGTNLAAVHYHFGSKEGLLRAIVQRGGSPLQEDRMQRLAALRSQPRAPSPRDLLRAFIEPVFKLRDDHPHFPELMARVVAENLLPTLGEVFQDNFVQGLHYFAEAFSEALPGVSEEEMRWRLLFTVGAFHFVCKGASPIAAIFGSEPNPETLTERLLDFCEAGIVAKPSSSLPPLPPSPNPEAP